MDDVWTPLSHVECKYSVPQQPYGGPERLHALRLDAGGGVATCSFGSHDVKLMFLGSADRMMVPYGEFFLFKTSLH